MKAFLTYMLSTAFALSTLTGTAADEVEFTASAPRVVEKGEYFRLTYTLNTKGEGFTGPEIPDFSYSGPMVSTSMSTQIINGQVSQSTTYTYTYTMQASRTGRFTIPAARVLVNGKNYQSNTVDIEVVEASAARNAPQTQTRPADGAEGIAADDLFVRILLDKNEVYKGDQVLATIKVYTRVNLARFGDIQIPSFQGFWSQEIDIPDQISLVRETYQGRIYNVGTIKKTILVPQQSGEIRIDPFELECYVNVQSRSRSIFDDFFGSYQTVKKQLVSPPVSVQVKNLPAGAPKTFSGAVGQFTLSSQVNKTQLEANEALNYTISIRGKGNLMLIDAPDLAFPADFEVYDPKMINNYRSTEQGVSGEKTFEFLAIPRFGGEYTIPVSEFSYFDPVSAQYKTLKTESYTIAVSEGEQEIGGPVISRSTGNEIRMIGQDIRYIKTGQIRLSDPSHLLTEKSWFYLLYAIIFLLSLLLVLAGISRQKKLADRAAIRSRQAGKAGQKKLKKAREALKSQNKEAFLDEVLKAIWGYLGDKLAIDPSAYRRDLLEDYFIKEQIDAAHLHDFHTLLDRCEFLRYAPGAQHEELDRILQDAGDLINHFESVLGKRKKHA